jgi:acyl-CoA hydrolase
MPSPAPPSWSSRFAERTATAAEAVKAIRPGRRILVGSGAAEPVRLVEAMVARASELADNEIVHLLTLGPAPYVHPDLRSTFRHTALFIGANVRQAVQEGRADYVPVFLSEVPELIRSRRLRILGTASLSGLSGAGVAADDLDDRAGSEGLLDDRRGT